MPQSPNNPIPSAIRPSVLPTLWDITLGLLVIAVSLANYFAGKISWTEAAPLSAVIYGALTPLALAFFRSKTDEPAFGLKSSAAILAFFFSQFVTIGSSFFLRHDWSLCFGSRTSLLIWALQTLCYGYVFYTIILGCFCLPKSFRTEPESYQINAWRWFGGLLAIRIVYLLLLYPCVFDIDAAIGLRTFLDPDSAVCNHHPILVQALHALFFSIGKAMGYRSVGMALLTLLLICISCGILTYGLTLVAKSGAGRKKTLALAFFFLLFPFFPFLSVFATKDGMFAYSFLFYLFTLYELFISKGNSLRKWHFWILHIVAIIYLCLTRHQGIFFVLAEFPLLLFLYRPYWRQVLALHVLPLSLIFLFSNVLLPRLDVEPAGKQEVYGSLFHQTANYLRLYPDEVTAFERQAIDRILDCDHLPQGYSYNLTDGTKDSYKYNPMSTSREVLLSFRHVDRSSEESDLKDYRKAWYSMFLRHPGSYLQARLGVCLGFFFNNGKPLVKNESYWNNLPLSQDYIFGYYEKFEWIYHNQAIIWATLPVLSWFLAIPYYIWLALVGLTLLLNRKDWQGTTIFLPVILSIAFLLICPYASGRYAFPVVAALPLLIIYLLTPNPSQQCQE